jgi:rhodanese-related sulfurtransferase
MEWTVAAVAAGVIVALFLLQRMSFVATDAAREYLANGALVIDVRSPEEFRSDRVPGAINIPLGELRGSLSRQVKDKQQVLLVHCLSGSRSAIAKWQLKGLGYANVFNLGPLARAHQIVAGAKRK